MGLKLIDLDGDVARVGVSPEAERLVRDAEARIERFIHRRRDDPLPGFVPGDFRLSHAALALIRDRHLAPELTMCEWGSGFGVTACLATLLGYDACGIEVERNLHEQAQALADDHGLSTTFAQGSFIPDGGDALAGDSDDSAMLATDLPSAYDELGLDVTDFGLIYAYPWPEHEQAVERLFDAYAATGALLVTYRGMNHIHVHRKTDQRKTNRRRR